MEIGKNRSNNDNDNNGRFALYREIFSSVDLGKNNLICPIFVRQKVGKDKKISSMPGIASTSLNMVSDYAQDIKDAGISSVIIFGIPSKRDFDGLCAADSKKGIVQNAVRTLRQSFGNSLNIITDVCLCQYNFSGHCGVTANRKYDSASTGNALVADNDMTLDVIAKVAASHAEAGADMVAPSSMMDGQVHFIRKSLDYSGFDKTGILSYSAKHASSLYTPFRSATFSDEAEIRNINKLSYQVSYACPRQVLREIEMDIKEGADMVMVKPGMMYLDLVSAVKDRFDFPLAVQNVSGEFAMIKAAAIQGWIDEDDWKVSTIASIRRAGADRIISYFALDVASYI